MFPHNKKKISHSLDYKIPDPRFAIVWCRNRATLDLNPRIADSPKHNCQPPQSNFPNKKYTFQHFTCWREIIKASSIKPCWEARSDPCHIVAMSESPEKRDLLKEFLTIGSHLYSSTSCPLTGVLDKSLTSVASRYLFGKSIPLLCPESDILQCLGDPQSR